MNLVSLVKTTHLSNLKYYIEKSIDLINFNLDSDIRNIVIKANLCYYWDRSIGEVTSPQFVAELIDLLREHLSNPEICVVESDASSMKCRYAFKMLGYEKMADDKNVRLVNLSKEENDEVEVVTANRPYKFSVPRIIQNADLFINAAKMKYMPGTELSCTLKNIFGCNPYPKKFKCHSYLDEAIVSLNKLMKSGLCLVDGIIARGRETRKLGLIMASTDPVAIDSVAARIIGLNPKKLRHLVLAEEEGLGKLKYETAGEKIEYFARRFPRRTPHDKIQSKIVKFGLSILRKVSP